MTFWLNGEYREETAAIDIADRGFLLGDGVFETILLRDGRPAFLSEHLNRMRLGAAALAIETEIDEGVIAAALRELARRNGAAKGTASARLTLTRGPGPRGLVPVKSAAPATFLITVNSYAAPAGEAPAKLIVSRYRRSEMSLAARHKTLNYLDNVMARGEAAAAGADDAVMLNGAGRVACASAANIFLIRDGAVATPPLDEGAMPGIVRAVLLGRAKTAGIAIAEAPVEAQALRDSALFLTNSLIGLRAASVGGGREPDNAAQRILQALKSCYADAMSSDLAKRAAG
jgi:branched-subunit amino acid aminotransferase/4-amino-4-deoxychorismate lyase